MPDLLLKRKFFFSYRFIRVAEFMKKSYCLISASFICSWQMCRRGENQMKTIAERFFKNFVRSLKKRTL